MSDGEGDRNRIWARALVGALAASGVRHVCVSPGARSAPLALAVAERGDLATSVHVDERSAAFFAVGYGRVAGRPAALLCTSGTAAANYLPALVEAYYARVPVVAITADRPPELRDTGAWQAIDQTGLYGRFARWAVDLAPPDDRDTMLRYVAQTASRAVAAAMGPPPGPVHLNVPLREPLVEGVWPAAEPAVGRDAEVVGRAAGAVGQDAEVVGPDAAVVGRVAGAVGPVVAVPHGRRQVADHALDDLAARIAAEPRGLVLAGPIDARPGYAEKVAELASAAGYPILAEPTGALRFGTHDRSLVVAAYDAMLRATGWADRHAPRLVVRFGGSLTWRQVAAFLDRHAPRQVVVDPDGRWDDPTRRADLWLPGDPSDVAESLARRLAGLGHRGDGGWARAWMSADGVAGDALVASEGDGARVGLPAAASEGSTGPAAAPEGSSGPAAVGSVGWVYRALAQLIPDDAVLWVANSMAVRDVDTYTRPSNRRLRVVANRGAAGIDGTFSSALGAAVGSGRPTVLVSGDLAFAHDLIGLSSIRSLPPVDLAAVVLDDGGGGIFEHLPLARFAGDDFARFFLAPAGLDVPAACAAFGVPCSRALDHSSLADGLAGTGVRAVHVPVDRAANTAAHRRYWDAVAVALQGRDGERSAGPDQ